MLTSTVYIAILYNLPKYIEIAISQGVYSIPIHSPMFQVIM